MNEELVVLCYTEMECERTIDLGIELRFEKDQDRRRVLMGELDALWDTALERGGCDELSPVFFFLLQR